MANNAAWQITVAFQLLIVRPHVIRSPRVVASQFLDIGPVTFVGIWKYVSNLLLGIQHMLTDGDHGIVCCTSAQGSRTRIQDTEWLSSRRRILSNVLSTICSLPHHFGVSFLPGSVCVVLDVVVPLHRCVLRRLKLHCRHHLLGCISLIITSIDQKDRVTSESKTRRQRTTTRAGAYDNVFILAGGIHSSAGMFVDKYVLIMQGSGWDITKIL